MNTQSNSATAPTVFQFNQAYNVRVVVIDNEPWFCLRDVCKILDIKNAAQTAQQLDQGGVSKTYTPTKSGNQEITFISEPNLYRVIFRSNKPEAKTFQDWVFNDVLPAIRKTGRYVHKPTTPVAEETLAPNDHKNLQHLIWDVSGHLRFKDAWVQACWRAIRLAVNTPAPHPFKVADLPMIGAELRRVWAVSSAATTFLHEAESQFLKRAVRNGENIETLISEQRALLAAKLTTDDAVFETQLRAWQTLQLSNLTERKPFTGQECEVMEVLP